ncbi:MAG: LLM class F420-dependent oxidoreductase [Frankiaceae bacterium]|nr:LLM class F420-dependent oxidoreductase [Frankiaceae bacterium]MBV9869434.1 LLM class F420-dependent oxidoreductase [Frankiaceae bacterium]
MHVGISLFATDLTTDIRDVARAAEDAGFESLFVAEHSHIPTSRKTPHPSGDEMPIEYAHTLDPFVAMSMAAAVTSRLKVGTSICLVNERDPISLAKEVASLDLLSGGRLVFGVGAGWNVEEMVHHGIDPDRRWDIMRDRVKLMQALWTQEVASYAGEFVSLEPTWQWPKPVQKPLRVLIGGGGKRPMRHAVEYAGGWMPMPSKEKFGDRLATLKQIADEAGKPVPAVTLTGVRPDRDVLDHYAAMGIERAVLILPFAADVLPTIAEWSELVSA